MNLLLDTHILVWWLQNSHQLRPSSRQLIADAANLYWSAASSWELSIKYALGRLRLPSQPAVCLPQHLLRNRILSLPISDNDAFQAGALPRHHNDPFDRMLVAQAQREQLVLLSDDPWMRQYDVQVAF